MITRHAYPHEGITRRSLALLALAMASPLARSQDRSQDRPPIADPANPESSTRWQQVRKSLFGTRPIRAGDGVIALEAPPRAEDSAVVPVAMRAQFPQTPARHIRRMVLVIDNNPSPIAATFDYTVESGRADLETRVRVDEYTFMRVVAETQDGELYMATRYVKASGGCSAPPGKDPAAALASLGRMRMRVQGDPRSGEPVLAQLMVNHPNHSGLAMDQLTRQYTPAHFVRTVEVTYAGKPVLTADLDFAISENPHLRFWFVPRPANGELRATVMDSQDRRFEHAIGLGPPS